MPRDKPSSLMVVSRDQRVTRETRENEDRVDWVASKVLLAHLVRGANQDPRDRKVSLDPSGWRV